MSPRERLAAVESDIDALGSEFKTLGRGAPRRAAILRELRRLGGRRMELRYGASMKEEA